MPRRRPARQIATRSRRLADCLRCRRVRVNRAACSHPHADRNCHEDRDSNCHGDGNRNSNRDSYGHGDRNFNRDCDGNGDRNFNRDRYGHGDRYCNRDCDRDSHADCDGDADDLHFRAGYRSRSATSPVGDTVTKNITVRNTGTNLLFIGNVTSNDPEFAATGATTCPPGGLAHLATCTIAIGFTPSALGAHSATLSVNDNTATSPQSVAAHRHRHQSI